MTPNSEGMFKFVVSVKAVDAKHNVHMCAMSMQARKSSKPIHLCSIMIIL